MEVHLSRTSPVFELPPAVDIAGLGIDTHQATWLGRPAATALAQEADKAGLRLGDERASDRISLTAGGLATAQAIRAFVRASDEVDGDVIGALAAPCDRWCDEPAFGESARLLRLRGGGPRSAERLARATPVQVQVDSQPFDVPLLDQIGGRTEVVHGSRALLVGVRSWAGLMWANLLGLGPALLDVLPGPPGTRPVRLALAALRAASLDPERLGARLVRRGRGVRVHPSAVVEGSWLMDGAQVDAGAVVRHSIIGEGARVEPQALCIGSVLGPGACLQRRGFVTYGLLDVSAVCGGTLQLGYVGVRAQLKVGALLLDQVLGGPVRVDVGGERVPVPLGVLGAALGRESVVGARVTVAAGRVVPPQTTVVAGGDAILLRAEASAPGRYRVREGGLEPC